MSVKKITGREFTLNVLNGISMGVVVSLIPGALLGQFMQALAKIWPADICACCFGYHYI